MTETGWLVAGAVWLASVFLTYFIADSRDAEDKRLWLVIGMFYGPVGVLLALVKARPAAAS